jgi:hypothetical protein
VIRKARGQFGLDCQRAERREYIRKEAKHKKMVRKQQEDGIEKEKEKKGARGERYNKEAGLHFHLDSVSSYKKIYPLFNF